LEFTTPWSPLEKFFKDVPLSFRSLPRLTISDNLSRITKLENFSKSISSQTDPHFKINTRHGVRSWRRLNTLWVSKVTQCSLTPARNHFLKYHDLNFLYQKKITKFLFNFYSVSLGKTYTRPTLLIKHFLLGSGLVGSVSQLHSYLRAGFVFFNFKLLSDHYLSAGVASGDSASLVITPKLLATVVFWKLNILKMRKRFFKFLYYFRLRTRRTPPKQPSFRIPLWVDKVYFGFYIRDSFVEIDFLTQTAIYLGSNSPLNSLLYFQQERYELPFLLTIRSLNWKSLT
jgi:hypothetical protein